MLSYDVFTIQQITSDNKMRLSEDRTLICGIRPDIHADAKQVWIRFSVWAEQVGEAALELYTRHEDYMLGALCMPVDSFPECLEDPYKGKRCLRLLCSAVDYRPVSGRTYNLYGQKKGSGDIFIGLQVGIRWAEHRP